MHCFLKYSDMKFDGSTSSFTLFIPGSDKSGINGKCFQSSFLPCFSGSSVRTWNRRHREEGGNATALLDLSPAGTERGRLMWATRHTEYLPIFFVSLQRACQISGFVCAVPRTHTQKSPKCTAF